MSMKFEHQQADPHRWQTAACSAAKILDQLSTKTTFLVVRECFYGTSRFNDFVDRIGTSAPTVSLALKQLESAQIVRRSPYREPGMRSRDEYQLTSAGEDLLPVLMALTQWGDEYLQGGAPPFAFVNNVTGQPIRVRVTSDADLPDLQSGGIEVRANFSLDQGVNETAGQPSR